MFVPCIHCAGLKAVSVVLSGQMAGSVLGSGAVMVSVSAFYMRHLDRCIVMRWFEGHVRVYCWQQERCGNGKDG
jgi:hypothetical protein